jgi:hypothetical protein
MMNGVTRKQVLVQLDDAEIAALDRLMGAGESRSEHIRRAIDLYVEAVGDALEDLRYAEAYRRFPEDPEESAALLSLALEAWPKA